MGLLTVSDFKVVNAGWGEWWKRAFLTKTLYQPELNKMREILRSGDTFLDVGAWIGIFTLPASKIVGNEGRVVAFEPDPLAYEWLKMNIALSNLSNATAFKLGVLDFNGRAKLRSAGLGASQSSYVRYGQGGHHHEIETEVVTLDKFCQAHDLQPDLIKIDVEGTELEVLRGSQEVIKRNSPKLMIEFHGDLMPEKRRDETWGFIKGIASNTTILSFRPDWLTQNSHLFVKTKARQKLNNLHYTVWTGETHGRR